MNPGAQTEAVARVVEVDNGLRGVVEATSVAVALIALFAIPSFGVGFAVASSLPVMWCIARRIGIDRVLGIVTSVRFMFLFAAAGSVLAPVLNGGIGTGGSYFPGLVAVLGQAHFSRRRAWLAVGPLLVLTIFAVDIALGRAIGLFDLACAITLSVAIPASVSSIVELEQTYRRRSIIDPLTGCLNRRALATRAEEIDEHSAVTGTPYAVIHLDIDHFKSVNDTHGHALGDRVLAHVSGVVRSTLGRRFESVYRVGGEEFVVLLPGAQLAPAAAIAERLRNEVAATPFEGLALTASFGVACGGPATSVERVIALADERTYEAKSTGRNRVVAPADPSRDDVEAIRARGAIAADDPVADGLAADVG